jgi:3-phenylpropionate/cinnamic acid dioxygenase small subunit
MSPAPDLQTVTDRLDIADVLYRYARCIEERDFAGAAANFTADCFADYGKRATDQLNGSAAVEAWIGGALKHVVATSHHISNVTVRLTDSDHAEVVSYLHAWHQVPAPITPVVYGRYVDSFERTTDGWRIARRKVIAHGLTGFEHSDAQFHMLADEGAE